MKLDERFHCFGCGADGDVIDFAARLFRLPVKEAAERLAADFGIAPGIPGLMLNIDNYRIMLYNFREGGGGIEL